MLKKIYFWIITKFKKRMTKAQVVTSLNTSIKDVFVSIYKALSDNRDQQQAGIDLMGLHDAKEPDESSLFYEFSVVGTPYKIEAQVLPSLGRAIFTTYVLERDRFNVHPKDTYSLIKALTIEVCGQNKKWEATIVKQARELSDIGILYLVAFCKALEDREQELRRRAGLD